MNHPVIKTDEFLKKFENFWEIVPIQIFSSSHGSTRITGNIRRYKRNFDAWIPNLFIVFSEMEGGSLD